MATPRKSESTSDLLSNALMAYFEEYGVEHLDGCPEDDTCDCPLVQDLALAQRRVRDLEREHGELMKALEEKDRFWQDRAERAEAQVQKVKR